MNIDVTDKVRFGDADGGELPVTKCVCGAAFEPWGWVIDIYDTDASECPECGRKLFFRTSVRVYQVVEV